MIVILDYGMGNPNSILNMINHIGGTAVITADLAVISSADAIILPGVGAFDNGVKKLQESGIVDILLRKVKYEKVPFLGICLGMQLLFDSSEEGELAGLGLIPGIVRRFDFKKNDNSNSLKIPHMGWNLVNPVEYETLYRGLEDESRFYFVHSFHVDCLNTSHILATANYGYEFTCSVRDGNIWGAQFHPEKSHRFGMIFFRNFLKEVECFASE